jgi:predicted phage gp36 major capsid-like protein
MTVAALKPRNAVESLREVVQDLLVPDLKALKVEVSAVRTEMAMGFDSLRTEMRLRDDNQSERSNHLADNIRQLSDKLDHAIDIRERLAAVEARLPRN